jgi:intracellular sulfur oxidation DsrE/DsrF family protein
MTRKRTRQWRPMALLASLTLFGLAAPAVAEPQPAQVIPNYGEFAPFTGYAVQPDPKLDYKVLFAVTHASSDAKSVNGSLERVARFVNILGAGGVRPKPGDLVVIVFGGATPIIAQDKVYEAQAKEAKNPNAALIKALQDAGVTVAVCGQAIAGRNIKPDQVLPGVEVDASAITTIATLQLRGWAFLPD